MISVLERGRVRLLYRQTRWLMRLRWVAGVLIAVLGAAHWKLSPVYDVGPGAVVLGAVVIVGNASLWAIMRFRPGLASDFRKILLLASAQIHFDILVLTLLTAWTGGLHSPVLFAFFLHMIFAGLLQPRSRAYAVAGFTVAAVAVALALSGQFPSSIEQSLAGLLWASAVFATVMLADRVARDLYFREAAMARRIQRITALSAEVAAQQHAMIQGEKMAAVGQLATGVAHEITNPLASMDSILQLVQRRQGHATPEDVSNLRDQVQRILRIVRQLTSFAHPGRGRVELVPINDVVRASLELLSLSRQARRTEVSLDLDPHAGSVELDPHAIQQVLANLLVNALDATSDVPAPCITLRTRRLADACEVHVQDNGQGIPPANLSRVFEPFFTTKEVGRGTGLGLSICAAIVRDHRATISVTSELGHGACFVITFPARAGSAPSTQA